MMCEFSPLAEKSFEMWPGVLRIAAAGPGAHGAVAAGIDAAREIAGSLMSDAELLTRGSVDVVAHGAAARCLLEAAQSMLSVLPVEAAPPLLAGLPGAVCDVVVKAMREIDDIDFASASLGDASSFYRDASAPKIALGALPVMTEEFLQGISSNHVSGGLAFSGMERFFPTGGVADLVATLGDTAVLAALSAAVLAGSMTWPQARANRRRIVDPLVAAAYEDCGSVYLPDLIPVDEIWQTLSKGIRMATHLHDNHVLLAAALTLKGRGRTQGPVSGPRLLRFGVSEWR